MNKKYMKGFTLIEMLMVVAIIGILASSILIGLSGARSKARDTRRITDLKNAQTALELYYSKYGVYPSRNPGSDEIWTWDEVIDILTSSETGLKISKVPKDPINNNEYTYQYATDGQNYILGAKLETKDQSLDDDLDGSQLGLDCGQEVGDTIYCISL